jgi:hypothetical protein
MVNYDLRLACFWGVEVELQPESTEVQPPESLAMEPLAVDGIGDIADNADGVVDDVDEGFLNLIVLIVGWWDQCFLTVLFFVLLELANSC